MIDDENTPDEGAEAPAPTKDDLMEEARELDIEGRSSMNKDELAAAVDAAKGNPPNDGSEVEYTGTGEPPAESGAADGVEVVDGEVVPASIGETITPPDQPEGTTEVVSGDEAPDVLHSGDVLPRHRREVDGVE